MSASVVCRGCGRRVRLPAGADPRTATCPECRGRTDRADPEPLSLDDAEPLPPVPAPADPRRPGWLLAAGAVLAVGLAAGPVVLGRETELGLATGAVLGLVFAGLAMVLNAAVALLTRYPPGGKVALMAGVCVALLAVFLFGAVAYLNARKHDPPPPSPPPPPPVELTPLTPTPPTLNRGPPTHLDAVYRHGTSRLDDGPAAVTALAVAPTDGAVVVGYADGTTRLWPLDQPTFETPHPGPRAAGAVRRIAFDPTGTTAYLTCDRGLAVAPLRAPRVSLVVPGDAVAVFPEPGRERFAAARGSRLSVRYVPLDLLKNPGGRAANGLVVSAPKDETIPLRTPADTPLPPRMFLAWHPAGRLLVGSAGGTILGVLPSGAVGDVVSRDHRAAVRAWAAGPARPDFVTGDDDGFVGFWPDGSPSPTKFRTGTAPVTHLALSPGGGAVAVADAAGGLSVWNLAGGVCVAATQRREPVAAVAWGPTDDLLLVADGNGVEVWSLPEALVGGRP